MLTSVAAMAFLGVAKAATSDWATNEGGRMRLIALPADSGGHIRAALQIEPNPGWITYWREPGESGIPPQISTKPESAAAITRIAYPTPKQINLGTIREIGYDTATALPIDFEFADGRRQGTLAITSFIGLCKQVCIPFQADFSLPLSYDGKPEVAEKAAIAAADASLPERPSTDFSVGQHQLSADGKALSLQLTLPSSDDTAPQVYLTGPSGYVFFRQTSTRRHGHAFDTEIAIGKLPKNYEIHGKSWGIIVVDGQRAIETTLTFD
jgi:DsbC/DsbD-like thiol-disulfide interchange protein